MTRRGYKAGVEMIALNDEPLDMDPEHMDGFASVMLLAFLFGKDQRTVAKDVVKCRKRIAEEEASRRREAEIKGWDLDAETAQVEAAIRDVPEDAI